MKYHFRCWLILYLFLSSYNNYHEFFLEIKNDRTDTKFTIIPFPLLKVGFEMNFVPIRFAVWNRSVKLSSFFKTPKFFIKQTQLHKIHTNYLFYLTIIITSSLSSKMIFYRSFLDIYNRKFNSPSGFFQNFRFVCLFIYCFL